MTARTSDPPGLTAITFNVRSFEGLAGDDRRLARAIDLGQMPDRFALELALYDPDVVCMQEAHHEELVARAADRLGMGYVYFPGNEVYGSWTTGISGAVITRFAVLSSENLPLVSWKERPGELFTRHFGRAVLRTDDGELSVFSAHLHPGNTRIRLAEIDEILKVMAPELEDGRSVLVMGDLNHRPGTEEYDRWARSGLKDSFAACGRGQPLTYPSDVPTERIDYIWCHGPVAARLSECRVLYEGAFRTWPGDARSFALSDHLPVMAAFGSSPE
ncbi:MAG: endonuclease/exonuclease/phosphatase family protein [Planctomycetota bacterium]